MRRVETDNLEFVAKRSAKRRQQRVVLDVVVVECAQNQNGASLLGNRRCVRHLAPRRDSGRRQEARAVATVSTQLDVFGDFCGDEVVPMRRNAGLAFGKSLLERLPTLKGDRVARAVSAVVDR